MSDEFIYLPARKCKRYRLNTITGDFQTCQIVDKWAFEKLIGRTWSQWVTLDKHSQTVKDLTKEAIQLLIKSLKN